MEPVALSGRFTNNCSFCEDENCGETIEYSHLREMENPAYGTGWKCCKKELCQEKALLNQGRFILMSAAELRDKYPNPRIFRSDGSLTENWKIISNVVRFTESDPWMVRVGSEFKKGRWIYKMVYYNVFLEWQAK